MSLFFLFLLMLANIFILCGVFLLLLLLLQDVFGRFVSEGHGFGESKHPRALHRGAYLLAPAPGMRVLLSAHG